MGNLCTAGGADVVTTCTTDAVDSSCVDQGDGTYLLQWRSKISGVYEAKVTVSNVPVIDSPCQFKLTSSSPELPKSEIEGEGLKHAVAGEKARVRILFYDMYGNLASPTDSSFKVKMAITHERKKIQDLKEHDYEGEWSADAEGEYMMTYVAKFAGHQDLHLWCDPHDRGERIVLPNSPFSVHVTSGMPSAVESTVEDCWTIEHRAEKDKAGAKNKNQKHGIGSDESADGRLRIVAGDSITVRPQIVDVFRNATKLKDGQLCGKVLAPDGSEIAVDVSQQTKSSVVNYELRYETARHGNHEMHITLQEESVSGSPIKFEVLAAAPDPSMCKLLLPENHEALDADYDHPAVVTLKTFDRYGNPCSTGGLLPNGRLSLIKKDANDQTILMPNNHSLTVEDMHDGTYAVRVALKMAATVKLTVNMDKNLPAGSGELPPVQLTFVEMPASFSKSGESDNTPPGAAGKDKPAKLNRRATASDMAAGASKSSPSQGVARDAPPAAEPQIESIEPDGMNAFAAAPSPAPAPFMQPAGEETPAPEITSE